MLVFFILLFAIMLYKCKVRIVSFDSQYLSIEGTTAVRGIFAILVLFSHVKGYISFGDFFLDSSYVSITNFLGQTIVTLFLFYSGYGIMEGIKKKPAYFDSFLETRFLKTLFHFDIAILLYWFMCEVLLGDHIAFSRLMQSFIGISSIRNSNWYVFCTLLLYLFVFFMFKLFGKRPLIAIAGVVLLCLGYIFVAKNELAFYWFDTIFCLPLGLIYSLYKDKIDRLMQSSNLIYAGITALTIGLFVLISIYYKSSFLPTAIFRNLLFTLSWVFISMKITFNNKILTWLGVHSFSIYIIQRIPMNLLAHLIPIQWNRYAFTALAFALSFLFAYLFSLLLKVFDKAFFKKKI